MYATFSGFDIIHPNLQQSPCEQNLKEATLTHNGAEWKVNYIDLKRPSRRTSVTTVGDKVNVEVTVGETPCPFGRPYIDSLGTLRLIYVDGVVDDSHVERCLYQALNEKLLSQFRHHRNHMRRVKEEMASIAHKIGDEDE